MEPKLDGHRARLHVQAGRAVAWYSRPGRELLGLSGLRWLPAIRWPVGAAVLDGELFSGTGMDGIDSILTDRQRAAGDDDPVNAGWVAVWPRTVPPAGASCGAGCCGIRWVIGERR